MDEKDVFMDVIRVWAGVAWADGVIAEEETAAMNQLVEQAGLGKDAREIALGYLKEPVDLDTSRLENLSQLGREGIYQAAVRLALVDNCFDNAEQVFLAKLREGLKIEETTAKQIIHRVTSAG